MKAGAVARYADERLAAAANGRPLPAPPRILADIASVRLALLTTLVYEALLVVIAVGVSRQTVPGFGRSVGLTRYSLLSLWRPALAVLGCYLFVGLYVLVVEALGIDALVPQSTVPSAVTRDGPTMLIAALVAAVAAPLAEETFFRGLVFTGLLRWGLGPAAAISALLFTGAHLDLGSLIPFFAIGVVLAVLYWWHASLWESIAFHSMFNSVSLILLYAGR